MKGKKLYYFILKIKDKLDDSFFKPLELRLLNIINTLNMDQLITALL